MASTMQAVLELDLSVNGVEIGPGGGAYLVDVSSYDQVAGVGGILRGVAVIERSTRRCAVEASVR